MMELASKYTAPDNNDTPNAKRGDSNSPAVNNNNDSSPTSNGPWHSQSGWSSTPVVPTLYYPRNVEESGAMLEGDDSLATLV